jgi:hypothetical protein
MIYPVERFAGQFYPQLAFASRSLCARAAPCNREWQPLLKQYAA